MPQESYDSFDYIVSSATSLSEELRRYSRGFGDVSNDFADKVERSFNEAAEVLRQSITSASWIPDSVKPPATPPPKHCPVHMGYLQRMGMWIDRNRALTAAIVAFVGTGTFLVWRHKRLQRQKRRARRAVNGAKTELVVLAGSPHSPITKSLALDLERKGFLVYIPVGTLEEEAAISDLRAPDVHALNFDVTSPESTSQMLDKLSEFLKNPQRHGTKQLHFASLVLLDAYPSTHPTGQITHLSPSTWSDVLNTHILYPITLAQAFLPLLISESMSPPPVRTYLSDADPNISPTTLIIITPTNIPSLHPPLHAPESLTTAALTSFANTLRSELPASLSLTHVRLGSFTPLSTPFNRLNTALTRLDRFRSSSASSSGKSSSSSPPRTSSNPRSTTTSPNKGPSGLRELHNGIFDAVVGRRTGTMFLGRGARTYTYVGQGVPSGLVASMLGYRQTGGERSLGVEWSRSDDLISRSMEWEKVEDAGDNGQ